MANLFDYINWRGDLDFVQSPYNPVDNIIFSQLSYLPFDGIVGGPDDKDRITARDALNKLREKLKSKTAAKKPVLTFKDDPELIDMLISSNRFGNCHLFGYVNQIDVKREIQFSAVGIVTGDDFSYIAYRGTDLTFVAWKEDFNMGFSEAVPAQLEAVKYLEKMAESIKGPLRLCGHSKGGNLAVFAASQCGKKTQKRITEIYSNDAPGFHRKVIESEGFAAIRERIRSFVPRSSIVGMLLEQGTEHTVIKSSRFGLWQHELYSWEVTHNDMVRVDEITLSSRYVDETLKHWIGTLDNEQREKFVDALYAVLSASEVESVHEFGSSWFKAAGRMLKSLTHIDEPTKKLLRKTMAALFNSAKENITILKPKRKLARI